MATDSESFNRDLYDLLRVRGLSPVPLDSSNKRVPASQEADVIQFTFTKDGKKYGDAWASIDGAQRLAIYYDQEQQESPSAPTPGIDYDDSWTGLLKHLKNWAHRRQLGFDLLNQDRLGDDMKQREYYKMKERVSEGYYPMNKKASYNDAVPNIKIIIQHTRPLKSEEKRYRNIEKIFLENQEGERFLTPTKRPGIARAYARHIAEGGFPNDEKWNHIKSLSEDYNKMAGFVRATKNKQFSESAQELIDEGKKHYHNMRETLRKLASPRGYKKYFDSWKPLSTDKDNIDHTINELFVQEKIDSRIENAIPILSRIREEVVEMKEIENLEEWADGIINEKLDLEEVEQVDEISKKTLKSYRRKAGGELGSLENELMGSDLTSPEGIEAEKKAARKFDNRMKGLQTANMKMSEPPVKVYATNEEEIDEGIEDTIKKGSKSLKRGMKGWEKGMHDVESVKRANMSLSPEDKEKILKSNPPKGSPAELQQKLIKREKNKTVEEDSTDRSRNRKMKMATDYEERAKKTKSDIKKVHFRKMADEIRSSIAIDDKVKEDLGPEQKRVGQLGPTGGPAKVGDLVGASESKEIDLELARITELSRNNK